MTKRTKCEKCNRYEYKLYKRKEMLDKWLCQKCFDEIREYYENRRDL